MSLDFEKREPIGSRASTLEAALSQSGRGLPDTKNCSQFSGNRLLPHHRLNTDEHFLGFELSPVPLIRT
jgi:hypothetical protein